MTELEEKLLVLVDAMLENQPRLTSDRYFVGLTTTVPHATEVTITFTFGKQWVIRLLKAYADSRSNCTYKWMIDGKAFDINEIEFYKGKPITGENIKLIIANSDVIDDQTIGYFVMGWGDLKAGG